MFRFASVKWSPVEISYLKEHREDMNINQLSLALAKSRNAITRKLAELDGKSITKKKNKRSVIGKREDLKQFFRSNWEANFARWLNLQGQQWEYEPKVFWFIDFGIRKGTIQYCPDFKVGNTWIEIKGMLDNKGRTAIKRFKKYYPEEFKNLKAVVGRPGTKADKFFKDLGVPILAYINQLEKKYKEQIPKWE